MQVIIYLANGQMSALALAHVPAKLGLSSVRPSSLKDRPFNLKGGLWFF
jgi:hypothetical protein